MQELLFALWFFLPAGIANGAPVIANKIPILNKLTTPMDFGKHYKDRRIFGDNKTWRGLLFGIFSAVFIVMLQRFAYQNWGWAQEISQGINYGAGNIWLLGMLLGLGALLGDAVESFIKRQMHIPSGESWFPLDQFDYVIGGLLASAFFVVLSLEQYVVIFILWFSMHIFWAYFFYLIGFKDKPI